MTLSNAERQARHRARIAARLAQMPTPAPATPARKARRQTRPTRWSRATDELLALLDELQAWRDGMPEAITSTATAERLDEVLELRELVEQLAAAELPKGFGRD